MKKKEDREVIKPLATEEFVEKCMADLKAMGMNEDGDMEENEETKAVKGIKIKHTVKLEMDDNEYTVFRRFFERIRIFGFKGIGLSEDEAKTMQSIIQSINMPKEVDDGHI